MTKKTETTVRVTAGLIRTLMIQAGVTHDELPMWVIYDRPTDYPDGYIARLHLTFPQPRPTPYTFSSTLDHMRDALAFTGFVNIGRQPKDDAKIVEVWI